ncbi:uncharacterized protein [Procambarus clarkii]|uniref:uncharacterized protein isoform X1 n=1 Tax=Procambarus clarkii TaxID=6728 RepID=UPI0037437583
MEDDNECLKDVILEELTRLGVQESERKGHQSAKLLGISNSASKSSKSKGKGKRSPKISGSRSPLKQPAKGRDDRKHTPKSPFSSAKRKAEIRRQQNKENKRKQVFGRELEHVPSVCVYLSDGIQVTVPEFLVDVCNLVRRNITTEGIFRKAGSSQRQSNVKKLIDSGSSLSNSVHVIDAACLLKQFLRSLPDPLLSSDVHSKIVKCMDLVQEARIAAIVLCTLLLPRAHRYTLVYLMDFFSDVVAASGSNLMDARNLAIVLAPNLLPTTFTPPASSWKSSGHSLPSEDVMLATNIEILQLLIESASLVGRMPSNVALAIEHREKSQSTENLLAPQSHSASRKKRRSASIHRLMTGLRRVVGHTRPDSTSPLHTAGSIERLDTLHLHPGVALSPMPGSEPSPRKRKSADAFALSLESVRDQAVETNPLFTPPTSKRAKVDIQVGTVATSATTAVDAAPSVSASLPLPVCSTPSLNKKQNLKMGQPCAIREITGSQNVLSQQSGQYSLVGNSSQSLKRSTSVKIGTFPKSPSTNLHTIHPGLERKSFGQVDPLRIGTMGHKKNALSQVVRMMSPVTRPVIKRRSCDIPLRSSAKRANCSEEPIRVTRRNSSNGWRINFNEPDGADGATLGSRGVPDGAECTLRGQLVPNPVVSNSIESLEQQYDDIKSVLKTMEDEFDKSNVQQMKEVFFPNSSSTSAQNMSYSEMIQSAYERMKVETKELGISPSDSLSKRLGKELKIRKRKSEEHRVIRSPSERKIGTIRRRSRELVQNAAKSSVNLDDTPASKLLQTPKMKGSLLQTPINASLRRGRPNSVKSGLPYVVRSSANVISNSPITFEETPKSRKVIVNKRNDGSSNIRKIYNDGTGEQPSLNVNVSDTSGNGSLIGSFLDNLPGPMTRRRSSLLSLVTAVPVLKFSSTETSLNDDYQMGNGNSSLNMYNTSDINMEIDEQVHTEENLETQKSQSAMSVLAGEEQWMTATEFVNCVGDQESLREEESIGRPSLAALIKQKKVTANVQLFNNLNIGSPHQRRQSRRLRSTPLQLPPEHSSSSEHIVTRLNYSKSMSHRSTMTPRELLKARQKSFQFDRAPHNLARIAVVSPLKESTWINIQQEHSHETPKAYRGEATFPNTLLRKDDSRFKAPESPITFVTHNKNALGTSQLAVTETSVNPPKLPPRSSVKPSPIRVQYR